MLYKSKLNQLEITHFVKFQFEYMNTLYTSYIFIRSFFPITEQVKADIKLINCYLTLIILYTPNCSDYSYNNNRNE